MKFLKTCMDSLRNQDTGDFDILIVDNHSEDESVPFLRTHYPEASLSVMEENLGFTGAVNYGITHAKTPYVLLLNNDVEAEPHFVRALTDRIEQDTDIFSVSARMVNFRDRTLLDDCGDIYTVLGWQGQRGVGQKVTDKRYARSCRVFSSCGGAAIYRRAVFDEIGLFDPDHFAYLEDIDVGYRAMIYGYRNVYEPDAVVYHVGSGASGAVKYSDFKVRLSARNSVYLIEKNMPLLQKALNALPILIGRKVKQRFFRKKGFEEAFLDGLREGRANRKKLKKVPVKFRNTGRYLVIEGMMIRYTFTYVFEKLRRSKKA